VRTDIAAQIGGQWMSRAISTLSGLERRIVKVGADLRPCSPTFRQQVNAGRRNEGLQRQFDSSRLPRCAGRVSSSVTLRPDRIRLDCGPDAPWRSPGPGWSIRSAPGATARSLNLQTYAAVPNSLIQASPFLPEHSQRFQPS